MKHGVLDLVTIALLAAILFVSEQALAFLPNIQVTVFLIVLYTRLIGFKKTMIIIIMHTLLDNLLNGSFIWYMVLPMGIGWSLIPLLLSTVFKKVQSTIGLALFGLFFGFLYGWVFIPFVVVSFGINWQAYLLADLSFELIMGLSSAISIGLLYQPIYHLLKNEMSLNIELNSKKYSI